MSSVQWPQKTRELKSVLFDSTRWNGFPFRDDDIVVVTWSKTGLPPDCAHWLLTGELNQP